THAAARSLIVCAVSRLFILFRSYPSLLGRLLVIGNCLQYQFQTFGYVILDDMFCYAQPLRNLSLGQSFYLAKFEYFPASVGQSLNQSAHPFQLTAACRDPFGGRFISYDVQALDFRNGFDPNDACPAQAHQDNITRSGKEICTATADMADILEAGDLAISFLDDVFKVFGIECPAKPDAHVGLVRKYLTPHPGHDPCALRSVHIGCLYSILLRCTGEDFPFG